MFVIELNLTEPATDDKWFEFQAAPTIKEAREVGRLQNDRDWRVVNALGRVVDDRRRDRVRVRAARARQGRDAVLRDLGLKKVRGALGGTYWE